MTDLKKSLSPDAFAMLTLEAQIEHLSALLPCERAEKLVQLCAEVRDPAPLAWLCRNLIERNWLQNAENRAWLASFLIKQAETTVHKVLRNITEPPLRDNDREKLAALMIDMLKDAQISELSSICLVDRALRHHFSEEHDAYLAELLAQCTEALRHGATDKITLPQLAQLPAVDLPAMYQAAAASGTATTKALDELRHRLSIEAIEVLGDAPKAVSQANAEDLLARRVYTDPGHFLIELLQNAEDSGARHWRVLFDSTRIVVWHDGTPFDARDVVGVTSIGQTTKRKQQIGFFGVGFKSVYEVTDRPQIYSDVWKFEIADVSIPKVLAQRPDFVPPDGTVLVLPLRANLDHERSPKSLYEKATQLDACVLLTLRSIDVIELELTAAAGGPARHALVECVRQERSSIRHEPSGKIRTYIIRDDRYDYEEKAREAGRPDQTMVMVGVLFDEEHHKPVPLEDSAATVYSYLPTREKTGLRFFVQGHFDVPLDRERIAPDSEWNRWILSQVPHQLARIAQKLSDDRDLKSAEGFLDVLPLRNELAPSLFQLIVDGLKPALQPIAFVPAVDHSLRAPENVLVAPPQIAALFQGKQVSEDQFLLNPLLNARAQELVLSIGAAPFDTPQLLAYLEALVPTFADGKPPTAVAFLSDFNLLENVYDILLAEADRLEREDAHAELAHWLERLKKLPIVTDTDGRLAAPQRLARGSSALRAIYSEIFKFVEERLENASPRTMAFLNRTGVLAIDVEYMVEHLELFLEHVQLPLSSPEAVPFPGDEQRLSLILRVLSDSGWEQQKRASRLPLFRSIDGVFWPAAQSSSDMKGVLRVQGSVGAELAKLYGKRRPLADVNDVKDASSLLLDRVAAPLLDLSILCQDLAGKLFGRDLQTLRQLHVLLESVEDEISDKTVKQLRELPIWPDRNGEARPLIGEKAVLIPDNEELCQLFSQAPFLDKEVCARTHIKRIGVDAIGVNQVVHALTAEAKAPLAIERNAEKVEKALDYLVRYAAALDSKSRIELKSVKAFLSDNNAILHLQQLSTTASPALRSIYGSWSERHFVSPEGTTLKLIRALAFDSALAIADTAALIADLEKPQRSSLIPDRQSLRQLLSYLASEADSIAGSALARLTKLPIFPDQKGAYGTLPSRNSPDTPSTVRPCEASVRPLLSQAGLRLLDADIESVIKPVLDQVHTPYAGLEELIEYLTKCPVLPDNVIEPLQKMLVDRKPELIRLYPVSNEPGQPVANLVLNSLPMWRARSGNLLPAREVVAQGAEEIVGQGTAEGAFLNQRSLDDQSFQRLRALAPLVGPKSCELFICELVRRVALDKQPLSAQPLFLSSVERVNQINSLIARLPDIEPVYVDASDHLRLVPLCYADPSTYALLQQLPVLDELLHPDFQQIVVQRTRVLQAQPGFSKHVQSITGFFKRFTGGGTATVDDSAPPSVALDCQPFPPHRTIAALGAALEEKRHARFYAWLEANEEEIYADTQARKLLAEAPFFRTRSGAMVCPRDLVIETDLPDIGLDWFPSPEIPQSALAALQKHLNVGRPKLNDLIKRNVLPAYIDACETLDREKAGRLLQWLAQRLSDRSAAQIRELIAPKDVEKKLLFEDLGGNFRSLEELVIPAARIAGLMQDIWGDELPTPSPSRYSPLVLSFLTDLGVSNTPSLSAIRTKLQNPQTKSVCAGLAGLACYLRNVNGETLLEQLPLRKTAWLQDGTGAFRLSSDLFIRTAEIESIAGSLPELYLADGLYDALGDTLGRELKFRDINSITFEDVARHIRMRTEARRQPAFAVYAWLDQQVQLRRIDGPGLSRLFGTTAWIWTDDGEVFPHAHVLGTRAFHLFKSRRGYWERGFKECRALCTALGIPATATANVVADFVEELGREAKTEGSHKVLADEPALPHMLLAAFNILGEAKRSVDRNLPIIPCINTKNESDLLPATAKNLFWSDTPTLDVLFSKAGPLCLAMRGRAEEREGVENFHQAMGVLRLRDAYRLLADGQSGNDRSEQRGAQIAELRSTLRALASVLPRIELERPLVAPSAWVYSKRLRALGEGGAIKAVDNLGVLYVLPGVGETRVQQMATYDQDDSRLIVDTRVLNDSERTGLAEGLIAAIVEGPMAETFIDLVEILLARVTKERMNEYLNRRHFADATAPAVASEVIAERINEILDYGLDRKLKRSFPSLSECALERWRDPAVTSKIETVCLDDDVKTASRKAVPLLIDSLDLKSVPDGLPAALEKMLGAQTLSDASSLLMESSHPDSPMAIPQNSAPEQSKKADSDTQSAQAFSFAQDTLRKVQDSFAHTLADVRRKSPSNQRSIGDANKDRDGSAAPQHEKEGKNHALLLGIGTVFVVVLIGGCILFLVSMGKSNGGTSGAPVIDAALVVGVLIFTFVILAAGFLIFAGSAIRSSITQTLTLLFTNARSHLKKWWSAQKEADPHRSLLDMSPQSTNSVKISNQPSSLAPSKMQPRKKNNEQSSDWQDKPASDKRDAARTTADAGQSYGDSSSPPRGSERAPFPLWAGGNGFRQLSHIGPQLWATRSNRKVIASNEVEAQLRFSPPNLPPPYLYAVNQMGISFNHAEQSWRPNEKVISHLNTPGFPSGRYVQFEGTMQPGENHLPLPLYGRIVGDVEVDGGTLQSFKQDALTAICMIAATSKVKVRYRVQLLETPKLEGKLASELSSDAELLQPTLSLEDLPPEVQEWIEKTRSKGGSIVRRALAAQAFIRRNYAYDDGFLERPEVRRARARLSKGKGNHHIALLHASSEGTILGRGVCYELNVLLVELLRRLDVPAVTATGWVLSGGIIDLPDHLFALAVVPSAQGACLLTLDAAATDQGPIRPLGQRKSSTINTNEVETVALPPVPAPTGAWNNTPTASNARFSSGAQSAGSTTIADAHSPRGVGQGSGTSATTVRPGQASSSGHATDFSPSSAATKLSDTDRKERRYIQAEIALLRDAIHRVCKVTGANEPRKMVDDVASLENELIRLLGDRPTAEIYLLILRGHLYRLDSITPQVQKLVHLGLAHIEPQSAYKIAPVDL